MYVYFESRLTDWATQVPLIERLLNVSGHMRFILLLLYFNVYFSEREREKESVSGGGAEREGDTEPEAGSRLRAVSTEPNAGLKPTDLS